MVLKSNQAAALLCREVPLAVQCLYERGQPCARNDFCATAAILFLNC